MRFLSLVGLIVISMTLLARADSSNLPDQVPDYWRLLLHEQKSFFGGWTSEVSNPEFFVTPEGQAHPEAELAASLKIIREHQLVQGQPFECLFPVRYHFLKAQYSLSAKEAPCTELHHWKDRFAAQSVTVIFATAFLGNVASSFGHVYLRVDSRTAQGPHGDLLDFGFSYAAINDPNDNIVKYAWKGLTGGYVEGLSIMPYFTRLSEYHNIENRDVWEYKLKLSPEQVDRLLDHVWELNSGQMSYYFLNRNCAYHISVLLKVANPDWQLASPNAPWVVPSDEVKRLAQNDAIASAQLRPAIYQQLKQKIAAMSSEEKADFLRSQKPLQTQGHSSALVVEALLDYQQFQLLHSHEEPSEAEKKTQDELFLQLSKASIKAPTLPSLEADTQPDLGHASSKMSLGFGSGQGDQFVDLEWRLAIHDWLDDDLGYTPFSQIEVGKLDFRYSREREEVDLHSLTLVNIVSLAPVDSLQRSASWLANAGAYVPPDSKCLYCLSAQVQGGFGLSTYLTNDEAAVGFAFIKWNVEDGSGTPNRFRTGPSELIGADWRIVPHVKWLAEFEMNQYFNEQGPFSAVRSGFSWSYQKNQELRLLTTYQQVPTQNYVTGNLLAGFYF